MPDSYLEHYAEHWTPGGTQTRSKGLRAYGLSGQIGLASHGIGSRLWTTEKKSYIDWCCGLGAMTLGYGRREIEEAVGHQLVRGCSFSIPSFREAMVAEQLCAAVPCAEQVRWVKTGSEACEAAVRIARKATGRPIVLTVRGGYHGWHSWFQAANPEHPGVPECYMSAIDSFAYNDLGSLEHPFPEMVAAVILEPTLFTPPEPGFLVGVREWCRKHGAVLIFDECVLGFRLSRAGGQEYFGVQPDLAVFGKALAGGYPLACVCGPRELMEHADVVSGTFGGDAVALAAAGAVLDIYEQEAVCARLKFVGNVLNNHLLQIAKAFGCEVAMEGYAPVARLRFPGLGVKEVAALALFTQEMARQGVLWHPRIRYASAAHTNDDIDQTADAAREAFRLVGQAIERDDWGAVGQLPEMPFARRQEARP